MKNISLLLALMLQACAVTQPVVGQFPKNKDDFMGEATASVYKDGTFHIQSQSGIICDGSLKRPTSLVSGNGEIKCSDGRTGSYVFTKNNEYGGETGFGTLSDGEKFRFLWGNQVSKEHCDFSSNDITCSKY